MFTSFSSSKSPPENLIDVTNDVADTGLSDIHLPATQQATSIPMSRTSSSKGQFSVAPPRQSPYSHQPSQSDNSSDTISLLQARRLANDFPKAEPTPDGFIYKDTASFEVEINEWFFSNDVDYIRVLHAKQEFENRWGKFGNKPWIESETSEHERFLESQLSGLLSSDVSRRCKSLLTIMHIVLGVWDVTAQAYFLGETKKERRQASKEHLKHIKDGIYLLAKVKGISILFEVLRNFLEKANTEEFPQRSFKEDNFSYIEIELDIVTTIFFIVIEQIRNDATDLQYAQESLNKIAPDLAIFLLKMTASLRWKEFNQWPLISLIPLLWKSILFVFGGVAEADALKRSISENQRNDGEKIISASPLDYHIFRQEIISKYPAYTPPEPILPLEPDNYSILPPIPSRRGANGSNGIISPALDINSSGASILHQSVHIDTPAPSPPPSPPVGGQSGKKQNYQTNQNFPFMYPPLDCTSNSAGGKGLAGLQERLVGRQWKGSDIPKSILEAGDLFAQRMRMTRAIRQLWDERENYIKFDRGWDASDDIGELKLDSIPTDIKLNHGTESKKSSNSKIDYGPTDEVSDDIKNKLVFIDNFYNDSLPHLQSLVLVLLKAFLSSTRFNTSDVITTDDDLNNVHQNERRQLNNSLENSEMFRPQEIISKAVSGILLLLLKWFKLSHVLKFEYLTQLLLDLNYVPSALTYFARLCSGNFNGVGLDSDDDDDMSFFAFCKLNSVYGVAHGEIPISVAKDSEDEAIPPPIKNSQDDAEPTNINDFFPTLVFDDAHVAKNKRRISKIPEIGHSSKEVISNISTRIMRRSLLSTINLLRILQKICKNKTHRNLLLVRYKAFCFLKGLLRIPQIDVRIYTLKLYKNQVPFCGRKWRQGNMRVITAIYLHCRPELRNDWLANCDINADIEDALPLEQALRSLTHWYNINNYPGQMGINSEQFKNEYDFFIRELDKLYIQDEITGDVDARPEKYWDFISNGC
ncbi:putative required for hyphal anastomosis [Golovinomyces cichoracearum]|uniref:Putative required for hyphal anastomosis n=1 Tax=Golovinomyces cichoracearum TaxID=62708 RepID=A0A420HCL3_9PEZI|nr:putative required for hyphal anastomosis [Golovinomyces cichoracearum]